MADIELENLNILIVEDSPTQAFLLKELLEKNKLRVTIAKDGMEAIQSLHQSTPHVIVTDIEMPKMNGYELCKQVRSDPKFKEIPVILLTNLTDPLDVIKGIGCGANSFLTKPCDIQFLLSTIKNTLKNKNLNKEFTEGKLEFFFGGKSHFLEVNQVQITELLLSTYLNAIQKNKELEESYRKLNLIHEELEKNNDKLKKLNEQKNQFLGMAAHDLRNPLSVIAGYSDLLMTLPKDGLTDEKSNKMLSRIKESSAFMLHLINDLLDFSIIESGKVSLHLSEVDIIELIQKDLIFFENLAKQKNITLNFNFPTSPIRKVLCDPQKIDQILNNLVSNAIKFSHPGGKIEIALIPTDSDVTLSVKDYGTGIPVQALEHIFQPFAKLSSKGTAGEKGFGLGLAIVNKIVIEHNGTIWVESEVDKGSTFYVSIPYTQHSIANK